MPPVSRTVLKGFAVIAVLVAAGYLLKHWGVGGGIFTEAWMDAHVRHGGATGAVLFVAIGAVFTAIGFPRQAISFLAGYAFGLVGGTVLALAATGAGCVITFVFSRYLARAMIAGRYSDRIAKADEFFRRNTFTATLLIRFLPLGSNVVTNMVAGVSRAGAVSFVAGSVLGYIPQTLIFALLGSGISLDPELRISLSVVLFLVSALLGIHLFRRYRKNGAAEAFE